MIGNELRNLSAAETAEAVRRGRLGARESVVAALGRIDAADRRLRAVDVVRREEALVEADAVDPNAPLAGVPVLVKAENDVAGLVTTFGGRAGGAPATADAEVVRRLRAAGAVVVGTSHLPEFGQYPFTEGAAWGATANPWDLTRSPGGSSGGSAAAVAAGLVPLAIGGDGGGSIRIPAACCGLVGLKPVRGRVSTSPHPDLWGALGTIGPLTRSVADTALAYDSLAGTTDIDRFAAPGPAESFAAAAAREPGRLRIAWLTRAPWPGVRTDPEVAAAVREVAARLGDAGHDVVEVGGRWPDAQRSFVPQFFDAVRVECTRVAHPERLEVRTRANARAAAWVTPTVLRRALAGGAALARAVRDHFAGYDVVLTPTTACLPPPIGRLDAAGTSRALARSMPMIAFTSLANVTGHAALSLPGGTSRCGLPVGVQLYAPHGDETTLLPLAAQLERLAPWPLLAPDSANGSGGGAAPTTTAR